MTFEKFAQKCRWRESFKGKYICWFENKSEKCAACNNLHHIRHWDPKNLPPCRKKNCKALKEKERVKWLRITGMIPKI